MAGVLTGEFAGEWWLPGDPDQKWGGFLRLGDGEQPRLHIAGLISDLQRRLGTVVVEHPAIQGITADGKAVTLVGAVEAGGQMALFHQISGDTIVTAPRAYVGDHFDREEDARFRRLALRLTYLDSWLPPPLIDRYIDFDGRGRMRRSTITLLPPRSITVRLPFGKLELGHDSAASGDLRTEAKFTQRASIVATTERKQPLDWWLTTVIRPLRYLLSISTELPISVEEIRLRPFVTKTDGEVEVVWSNDRSSDARDELHHGQMLVWAGDIIPRIEPAFRDWFAAVSDLEDVFNQFFATYNTSRSFVETRFTMTASSAEAYHRVRIGGTVRLARSISSVSPRPGAVSMRGISRGSMSG